MTSRSSFLLAESANEVRRNIHKLPVCLAGFINRLPKFIERHSGKRSTTQELSDGGHKARRLQPRRPGSTAATGPTSPATANGQPSSA